MQSSEKLCLQWNDFKDNVSSAFGQLREDKELTDVTLACEDGHQIEAHKVILAAPSPFFMQLLRKNKHSHPLVFMRGVKSEDLAAIVDFLYLGEAKINHDRLDAFLALAEELKLKGLTGSNEASIDNGEQIDQPANQGEKFKGEPNFKTSTQPKISAYDQNETSEKQIAVTNYTENLDLEELDHKIDSMMSTTDRIDHNRVKVITCNICGKEGPRSHVMRHIEANHITGISHSCKVCGKSARSRHALRVRKYSNHTNQPHN